MSLPSWADERASSELQLLVARGEGQGVEFKRELPSQITDLAKEIAAFASSNSGTILLGVDDGGEIVGLKDVESASSRDELQRRLEGICSGTIKPAVTPLIAWAVDADRAVLKITVPKGSEPVYYVQQRPYLRHMSTSRTAEPHEVIELVRRYIAARGESVAHTPSKGEQFWFGLKVTLARVLAWAEVDFQNRMLNPRFERWRTDCSVLASNLRGFAASDLAQHEGLQTSVSNLADLLDSIVSFHLTLGNGRDMEVIAQRAFSIARNLDRTVDTMQRKTDEFYENAMRAIREYARRLNDIARRASVMVRDGRIEQLQADASGIGFELTALSFFDIRGDDGFSGRLRKVGVDVQQVEGMRIYMDGGKSVGRLVSVIVESANALQALVDEPGDVARA
ncbi:ATP-binding protein [Paraburkholderia tropica]|uniref:AlbA family DNA-binding domain-containing protein n=1 Tax=Paraburkholderia tropica TaxID=92647 RepID=UPI0030171D15